MAYNVGEVFTSKKPHACGGNEWTITRVGADIKIKCNKCGRSIFVSIEQFEKMKKAIKG